MFSCLTNCFQVIEQPSKQDAELAAGKGDSSQSQLEFGNKLPPCEAHEEQLMGHGSGCYFISSSPQLETACSLNEPACYEASPVRVFTPAFAMPMPLGEPSDEGHMSMPSPESIGIALASHLSTSGGSHNPAWDLPFRPPPIRVPATAPVVTYGMNLEPHGHRARRGNNELFGDPTTPHSSADIDPITAFLNKKDQDEARCGSRPASSGQQPSTAAPVSSTGATTVEVLAVAQQQVTSDPVHLINTSWQNSNHLAATSRQSRLSRASLAAAGDPVLAASQSTSRALSLSMNQPLEEVTSDTPDAEVVALLEVPPQCVGSHPSRAGYMLPATRVDMTQQENRLGSDADTPGVKPPVMSCQFLMRNSYRHSNMSSAPEPRDTWGSCEAPGMHVLDHSAHSLNDSASTVIQCQCQPL